jgi:DNA-binding MarR family transcriptional regulator
MSEEFRHLADLDRLIHEPARLSIVALLSTVESADFLYLMCELGLSKGNLSAHLTKLENAGYIAIEKMFRGKTPVTICRLTEVGRTIFQEYRAQIQRLIARTGGALQAES